MRDTTAFDVRRVQLYRLAGRRLRYRVYVTMEATWSMLALYVVAWDLLVAPRAAPRWALTLLVVLAVAHSTTMTFRQPWHLLKAAVVGGLLFAAATVLNWATESPFDPAAAAAVFGSAYYFLVGEIWTRREAASRERAFLNVHPPAA